MKCGQIILEDVKMGRRKRKLKYKDGDGKEYIIEGSVVDLSQGPLEELIGEALDAEDDDKVIKERGKEIKEYIKNHEKSQNKLRSWYELGKKLQFVDKLHLNTEEDRNEAFRRLFQDLKSSIWDTSDSKIIRYPQHMYTLSKLPEKIVFYEGMTWSRWFDILEYKTITNNMELLEDIIKKCTIENWSEDDLRNNLQRINKELDKNVKE